MSKKYIFVSRAVKEADPLTRRLLMAVRGRSDKAREFSILCADSDVRGIETEILKVSRLPFFEHFNYFFIQSFFFYRRNVSAKVL